MSTLRRNTAANIAGRAWVTFVGFLFIPIYLELLGPEAYGLVGFFATIQGVFGILDLGLGATVNRELARLSVDPSRRQQQRGVVRALEACYWGTSLASGALVFALAPYIAEHWLNATVLSEASVTGSVRLMGAVLAIQLPLSFYQGALMGLQRQVALNVILSVATILRSAVTVVALSMIAATAEVFFLVQLATAVLQGLVTIAVVWSTLGGAFSTRPRWTYVSAVFPYAAAISANSIVGVALTQLDKVLLSRLLPLEQFAFYTLAASVASFVWALAVPVNQALFPRFAQLVETGDANTLTALYHRSSQVMSVALLPAAITVALFSRQLMLLWTGNAVAADETALIVSLLVLGTALNGLVSVPGYLQAAAGWPTLMVYTNAVAAVLLVPAILVVAPRYGAPGAAFIWLLLNAGYLVFNVPLMHRRLLRAEQWRWYFEDLARPVGAAAAIALAGRYLMPEGLLHVATATWVLGVWTLGVTAAVACAPRVRELAVGWLSPAGSSAHV